jgi:hypothetical protein
MKEIATDRIWPPSKKEIKKGLIWYFILIVLFVGITVYVKTNAGEPIKVANALFMGAFGATGCFIFVLLFIHYPMKIIPSISSRAETKGKEQGNERSAERGRLLTVWGIRIYLLAMLALNIAQLTQNSGKNWGWSLFWFLLTCWLFSLVKQGMKPAKNFMSFLLILGIFSIFKTWGFIGENALAIYSLAFSAYGFIFGLILLLSQDVNYYISLQYEKLPKKIKDQLNKKESQPSHRDDLKK